MKFFSLSFITFIFLLLTSGMSNVDAYWCVARSDAGADALQTALDYACGAGADCAPIEETGLCYLPNTLAAHASYAFNSFYQRNNLASAACDFAGSATLAKTDPSYGSCVFPPNPSTAGPITTSSTGTTPPTNVYGSVTPSNSSTTFPNSVGFNPSFSPSVSTTTTTTSDANPQFPLTTFVSIVALLLVA